MKELEKLKDDGVPFAGRHLKVELKCFCCDAPARCFLKYIVGHTAYFACERCTVEGTWNDRVVFNSDIDTLVRTDTKFSKHDYDIHQKSKTPLINAGVLCVWQFYLDYMHLVCLKVTRRIINYLRKGPRKCKLSSQQLRLISSRLSLLKGATPSEFARKPRPLEGADR